MSTWSFSATLDGYALPSTYLTSLPKGPANDVPIITGITKDESGANYGPVENVTAYYYSFLNGTYDSDRGNWTSEFLGSLSTRQFNLRNRCL